MRDCHQNYFLVKYQILRHLCERLKVVNITNKIGTSNPKKLTKSKLKCFSLQFEQTYFIFRIFTILGLLWYKNRFYLNTMVSDTRLAIFHASDVVRSCSNRMTPHLSKSVQPFSRYENNA